MNEPIQAKSSPVWGTEQKWTGKYLGKLGVSRSHGQTPLRRQTSRTVKDVNGNKALFFNLGTDQLEKYDITAATASSTIYEPGIDRPLAEVTSSGVATFYHQDWRGNVVLLSSANDQAAQDVLDAAEQIPIRVAVDLLIPDTGSLVGDLLLDIGLDITGVEDTVVNAIHSFIDPFISPSAE